MTTDERLETLERAVTLIFGYLDAQGPYPMGDLAALQRMVEARNAPATEPVSEAE